MKPRLILGGVLLFALLFTPLPRIAHADTPSTPLPLDLPQSYAIDDPRLLQKVTISSEDITFGEVLAELSDQTHMALGINNDTSGSGVSVLLDFKDRPVIEVLNALWSVVSYKSSEWAWDRTGKGKETHYMLVKTRGASELFAKVEAFAWVALAKFVETKLRFGKMSPAERRIHIQEYYDAHLLGAWVKPTYQLEGASSESWLDMWRMVGELRTPEQVLEVMRGKEWGADIETLSPEIQKKFKMFLSTKFASPADGGNTHTPKRVILYSNGTADVALQGAILPMVYIGFEEDATSRFGFGALDGGSLQGGLARHLKSLWIMPKETEHHPVEARELPDKMLIPPTVSNGGLNFAEPEPIRKAWKQYWTKLTKTFKTPICILVSSVPLTFYHRINYKTLEDILHPDPMRDDSNIPLVKWHGDVLLGTYVGWFRDAESYSPAWVIVQVNAMEKSHKVAVKDLTRLCGSIEDKPWELLCERKPFLKALNRVRPLLKIAYARYEMARPNGLPLTTEVAALLPSSVASSLQMGATAVRLVTSRLTINEGGKDKLCFALQLQVLTPKRNWVGLDSWSLFDL